MDDGGAMAARGGSAMERAILDLLAERRSGATICPSEAARRVAGDAPERWRPLMDDARAAARRLVEAGQVVVTQRGTVVDPVSATGPIRIGSSGASPTPTDEQRPEPNGPDLFGVSNGA